MAVRASLSATAVAIQPLRSKFFITTPIFYVNAKPHIGHLYSALLADVRARWGRFRGQDVLFTTGTDEHGLKIQDAAAAAGTDPATFCTEISDTFRDMFDDFHISYDDYIRTSEPRHHKVVAEMWSRLQAAGALELGQHSGWYCKSDEAYLTLSQVQQVTNPDGSTKMVSVESGHSVEPVSEANYLFKLSKYQQQLLDWMDANPECVQPPSRFNEARQVVAAGLQDLSVSRLKERVSWGVPVPNDPSHTIYVWLDALTNYLTTSGRAVDATSDEGSYWPPDVQIVGKDILRFHAVYWPAYLMAAGLTPPKQVVAHGHWIVNKAKMSKSLGNVIDPVALRRQYGTDAIRYSLLRDSKLGYDAEFSVEQLTTWLNADLADTWGNLASRVMAPTLLPSGILPSPGALKAADFEFVNAINSLPEQVCTSYEAMDPSSALGAIFEVLRASNRYFATNEPWKLKPAAGDDLATAADKASRLGTVLYLVLESLRVTGLLLSPVMPQSSTRLLESLGVPSEEWTLDHLCVGRHPGAHLGERYVLFNKFKEPTKY